MTEAYRIKKSIILSNLIRWFSLIIVTCEDTFVSNQHFIEHMVNSY